jgi:hypothetical protein
MLEELRLPTSVDVEDDACSMACNAARRASSCARHASFDEINRRIAYDGARFGAAAAALLAARKRAARGGRERLGQQWHQRR